MKANVLFGMFVLPAIVFAVAYFPAVTQLSRGLVSPYAKADVRKRMNAAAIDGLLVVTGCISYRNSGFVLYLVAGAAYLLLRDSLAGQSVGKFLSGLVVISLETGDRATLSGSVRRNALLLLPGANLVALFFEARTVMRDPQGQRLGDRLAQTQVIEGFGARDLVGSFQEWLTGLGTRIGHSTGKPGRVPVKVDR